MMEPQEKAELIAALTATAELTGTELSKTALRLLADDLDAYPLPAVLQALSRVRRESERRLTLAAIMARLESGDGRPGANEAWAMIPQDEYGSTVMSEEMATAMGAAAPLLAEKQTIAARMTFIEVYEREVANARANGTPVKWFPSLGFDKMARAKALEDAEAKGRLTHEQVVALLPGPDRDLAEATMKRLTGPSAPADVREKLAALRKAIAAPAKVDRGQASPDPAAPPPETPSIGSKGDGGETLH